MKRKEIKKVSSHSAFLQKNQKAQVTIFIIIAIFIVGAILIFFLFKQNIIQNPFSSGVEKVKIFVEGCIESTGEEVISQIIEGGGYYLAPELSTESGITYYQIDNINHIPSKERIEEEINFWVAENLFFCTKNFIDFPEYKIHQEKIDIRSEILDEEIILDVKYPLTITKGESSSRIKDFGEIKIPVRMGLVYDSILEFQRESSEAICLSCLLEIVERNYLSVNMIDYDDETVVFFFKDELNQENPTWVFANKYILENE